MIGIFDSGFGGLTIHRALTEALPQADFIYLGDSANAPYGTREAIDVLTLTCVGVDKLFEAGCQLVIVVCNTASTAALRWIQQQWLPAQGRTDGIARNVIGIVAPTVEAALTPPATASLAVFATDRTVETGSYPLELRKRQPGVKVYQQACSGLVQLIESGAERELIRVAIHKYVGELYAAMGQQWPDRVILGCTHYPLVMDLFAEALPPGLPLIDQPQASAASLLAYLARHPEFHSVESSQRRFLATEFSTADLPLITRFWGEPVEFEVV